MAVRVLHVISARAGDGAEHQLRLLIRHLPQQSEVVTLSPPGPVLADMRAGGTVVRQLVSTHDIDLTAIRRLRRIALRGQFDVVHTHLFRAGVQGRLAARLAGVARIVGNTIARSGMDGRRYCPPPDRRKCHA